MTTKTPKIGDTVRVTATRPLRHFGHGGALISHNTPQTGAILKVAKILWDGDLLLTDSNNEVYHFILPEQVEVVSPEPEPAPRVDLLPQDDGTTLVRYHGVPIFMITPLPPQ